VPNNIVICCDGTGNEFTDQNSNVVKLYSTLLINKNQRGYYLPGVGTMGDPSARTWIGKKWSVLMGLAFGSGILRNIGDAYRYLMNTYQEGDRVFLFGFSRGAYTVRALAGVLHMYGLLSPGNEGLIPYVTQMFAKASRENKGRKGTLAVSEQFKRTLSRECPLHFVGVWDTVSSIGWIYDPIVLPFTGQNPIIKIGRQALAIDEKRCMYEDRLWGERLTGQDIKQVWFPGVHSDVGGSYPEDESQLSKGSLEWMLGEAYEAGLLIDVERAKMVLGEKRPPLKWMPRYVAPDAKTSYLHNSLKGLWWLLEFLPHHNYDRSLGRCGWSLPCGHRRFIPKGSLLHASVQERRSASLGYDPSNLPATYGVDYTIPLPEPPPRPSRKKPASVLVPDETGQSLAWQLR